MFKEIEISMNQCLNIYIKNISKINTGRASAKLLDNILIDCYGKQIPLCKLSYIVVEDFNILVINVFDVNLLNLIKKSILLSNLNINPYISGSVIRVVLPSLTFERRLDLIKIIRNDAEDVRILMRNVRRNFNSKIKNMITNALISKDIASNYYDKVQKITNIFINKLNKILLSKELELKQ